MGSGRRVEHSLSSSDGLIDFLEEVTGEYQQLECFVWRILVIETVRSRITDTLNHTREQVHIADLLIPLRPICQFVQAKQRLLFRERSLHEFCAISIQSSSFFDVGAQGFDCFFYGACVVSIHKQFSAGGD